MFSLPYALLPDGFTVIRDRNFVSCIRFFFVRIKTRLGRMLNTAKG